MMSRIFLLTLFYVCYVQLPVLSFQFSLLSRASDYKAYSLGALILVMAFLSSALWVYATSYRRWLFGFIHVPIIVIATVTGYMWLVQSFVLSPDIVASFFETTRAEASEFLTASLFVVGSIGVLIACFLWWKCAPQHGGERPRGAIIALLAVMVISLIPALRVNALFTPYVFIHQFFLQVENRLTLFTPNNALQSDIAVDGEFTEPVIFVVVIGESLRADHLGINGYLRDTTPRLNKRSDLVSFKHMRSCATLTRDALPCILKNKKGPSFINLLRRTGFETWWLGTQGDLAFTHNYLRAGRDAEQFKFTNTPLTSSYAYDRDLLPWFKEAVAKHQERTLIVLHTLGSHWNYYQRYPENESVFAPNCYRNLPYLCPPQHVINSYDNSVVYTDGFLDEIIAELEGKHALLVYVSDHGESLGEDDTWLHGASNRPEQRQAALMVWASASWQQSHVDFFNNIVDRRDQHIEQTRVFHTIMHCMGVKTDFVDPTLSLCYKADQ